MNIGIFKVFLMETSKHFAVIHKVTKAINTSFACVCIILKVNMYPMYMYVCEHMWKLKTT